MKRFAFLFALLASTLLVACQAPFSTASSESAGISPRLSGQFSPDLMIQNLKVPSIVRFADGRTLINWEFDVSSVGRYDVPPFIFVDEKPVLGIGPYQVSLSNDNDTIGFDSTVVCGQMIGGTRWGRTTHQAGYVFTNFSVSNNAAFSLTLEINSKNAVYEGDHSNNFMTVSLAKSKMTYLK